MIIGLTGGIATGKSTAAEYLKKKGAKIIDADQISHKITQKGEKGWKRVIDEFGKDILREDGEFDREKLGEIVFADKNKLQLLNSIVHPLVRQEMQQIIDNAEDEILIFEIPLLFESGLERAFDFSINVSVKKQKQKERLAQRDEIASQQQEQRINSQMSNEKKNQKADK